MQNQGLYLDVQAQTENPAVELWQARRNHEKQYEGTTENPPKVCIENCSEKWPENCLIQISLNLRPENSTNFICFSAASAAARLGRRGAFCSIFPANCLTNT